MKGLNLHALVRPVVSVVNPERRIVVRPYMGENMGDDGTPTHAYGPAVAVMAQIQPLPQDKLQFVANGQQSGVWRQLYLPGAWQGLDRVQGYGGDLFYFDEQEWQINPVQEAWGTPEKGWTHIVVQAQREAPEPDIPNTLAMTVPA